MKKIFILMTTAILFSTANAATNRSEFFYKPNSGNSSLDINYRSGNGEGVFTNSSGKSTTTFTHSLVVLRFDMAVGSDAGLHVATDTGSQVSDSSGTKSTYSGMGDVEVGFLGQSSALYYGADAFYSPGNSKSTTATADGNRYSGGNSLAPFFGVMSDMGLGVKAAYNYHMEQTNDNASGTTTTYTGRHESLLQLMYEVNYGSGVFGASYGFYAIDAGKTKTSGVEGDLKGYNGSILTLQLAHDLSSALSLLLKGQIYQIPEYDFSATTKVALDYTFLTVGVRFTF